MSELCMLPFSGDIGMTRRLNIDNILQNHICLKSHIII